jgi:hypothetical protein
MASSKQISTRLAGLKKQIDKKRGELSGLQAKQKNLREDLKKAKETEKAKKASGGAKKKGGSSKSASAPASPPSS